MASLCGSQAIRGTGTLSPMLQGPVFARLGAEWAQAEARPTVPQHWLSVTEETVIWDCPGTGTTAMKRN
jgi:hypothetical protein